MDILKKTLFLLNKKFDDKIIFEKEIINNKFISVICVDGVRTNLKFDVEGYLNDCIDTHPNIMIDKFVKFLEPKILNQLNNKDNDENKQLIKKEK